MSSFCSQDRAGVRNPVGAFLPKKPQHEISGSGFGRDPQPGWGFSTRLLQREKPGSGHVRNPVKAFFLE
jgi:hypothetical protein